MSLDGQIILKTALRYVIAILTILHYSVSVYATLAIDYVDTYQ